MPVKVVFVGNPLGGDDGIGPRLYTELRDRPELKEFQILEFGVVGFDLISYVEDDDRLIIVDAVHSKGIIGEVVVLKEKDLSAVSPVSMHDFGIEQTAAMLRAYKPDISDVCVVGITVNNLKAFHDGLSDEITGQIPRIKEEVVRQILNCAK
ncbi:MAG: hydrogenase maturation protease [archaeon]